MEKNKIDFNMGLAREMDGRRATNIGTVSEEEGRKPFQEGENINE